ncbi:MAG: DUF1634 domain-containing protein [Methanomassiliicoccales archaeon]|jgi:uncharacterized membrane protein|nr:DUF1634 domain-containing protein [Methanomassiliicoccales archaeon]
MEEKEKLDWYVRLVLFSGMILSVSLLIIGLVAFFLSPPGWSDIAIPIDRIPGEIVKGNPVAILNLGIVLLIATPLMRVIIAFAVFLSEKDFRYAGISLFILLIIGIAVLIGAE